MGPISIESRHRPNCLLHEIEQHVADAEVGVGVGPAPHRRQGLRGPRKKEVVSGTHALRCQPRAVGHVFDGQSVRRNFRWEWKFSNTPDKLAITSVGLLFEFPTVNCVSDQRRSESDMLPHLTGGRVYAGFRTHAPVCLCSVRHRSWDMGRCLSLGRSSGPEPLRETQSHPHIRDS